MARVAIIGGCRTPFVRAGGVFSEFSSLDMALHVTQALCSRLKLDTERIDELVSSAVLFDPRYPNAAREIVLRGNFPKNINAHFVSNNCISGLVASSIVAAAIKEGRIKCGLAVGSESMSNPTLTFRRKAEKFFLRLSRAKTLSDKIKLLSAFRPGFLAPQAPSPKEPSTGLTMGQHCELSAQEFRIGREVQDKIALKSHSSAEQAQRAGILAQEIAALKNYDKDNLIRSDTGMEKLSSLKPVFEKSAKGTITAGNSSALTDGASAVCLMDEDYARQNNFEILAYLDAIEFAAIKPEDGLLMAPAVALPRLLNRCGLKIDDIDIFEIHEAFGAQVAANLLLWEKGWDKYNEARPIGKIPDEKININGGSIAIGHPFAATGGRLLTAIVNEMRRSQKKRGVISICAAGAMAAAALITTD